MSDPFRSADSEYNVFFQAGGSLPAGFPSYIIRAADRELFDHLREGRFCYVLTARQMGKSSLRVNVMDRLRKEEGFLCASVDASKIGNRNSSVDQWYFSVIHEIAHALHLEVNLMDWWTVNSGLTPVMRFAEFLEKVCLRTITQTIVIFLDEIDAMLDLDREKFSTDDFFSVIRSFYNARVDNPDLNRLTFAFFGVAAPDDLMRDVSRTPFNIGQPISLLNFTFEESTPLLKGFGNIKVNQEDLLHEILKWTNGHPFLTHKLCAEIAENPIKDSILSESIKKRVLALFLLPDIHAEPNLSNIHNRILRNKSYNSEMLSLYQRILSGEKVKSDNRSFADIYLRLSGLVVAVNGYLEIDNLIYRNYFNEEWLKAAYHEIDRPFAEAMQRWIDYNKSADTALYGTALTEYTNWAGSRNDLSPLEHEYLEFCLKAQQKQNERARRRLIWVISSLAILMVASLLLGALVLKQRNQARLAEKNAVEAKIQENAAKMLAEEAKDLALNEQKKAQDNERRAQELEKQAHKESENAKKQAQLALNREKEAIRQRSQALMAKEEAEKQRRRADSALAKFREQERIATVALARSDNLEAIINIQPFLTRAMDILPKNPTVALRIAEHAYRLNDVDSAKALLYRIIANYKNLFYNFSLVSPPDKFIYAGFSPDQQHIVTSPLSGSDKVWDAVSNKLVCSLPEHLQGCRASFAPNNQFVASITDGPFLLLCNATDGSILQKIRIPVEKRIVGQITWCEFSPDSRLVLLAVSDNTARLIDVTNGNLMGTLRGHASEIRTASFSPSGNLIVTASMDGTVKIWSTENQYIKTTLKCDAPVRTAFFSPDERKVIITTDKGQVLVWEFMTDRKLFETAPNRLKSATFAIYSSNGKYIAINYDNADGSSSSYQEIWDAQMQTLLCVLKGHSNFVRSIAFSPNGTKLITASLDGTAKIWDLQTSEIQMEIAQAYRQGLPFESVKDRIEHFVSSGEVAALSDEQKQLYGMMTEGK
jgi:hypothetical protein